MSEMTVATPGQDNVMLLRLLQRIHTYGFSTKADFARQWADEIAWASSAGYVSTEVLPGYPLYGRVWKITVSGLQYLADHVELIAASEVEAYLGEPR